jgi:hypothetical protein
MKMNDTGNGD